MSDWQTIVESLQAGHPCALITVCQVSGSAPREAGARLVVFEDARFYGTIGGGTLEWQAIGKAREMIRAGQSTAQLSKHVLGADLGQCCGGVVQLLIEVFMPGDLQSLESFLTMVNQQSAQPLVTKGTITQTGVVRTVLSAPYPPELATTGTLLSIDESPPQLLERHERRSHPLYLFGAGHVGRALILSLSNLPIHTTWVDSRDDAFPAHIPWQVNAVRHADPASALSDAPDNAMVLVMTHSHQIDYEIISRALTENRFCYVGLIGSKTKRGRFQNRLKQQWQTQGLSHDIVQQRFANLTCPIGIQGIRSKHPASIATATAAQLLQLLEQHA